ncbi:hypothetical protein GCM10027176_35020 [Actinoallomurus bryophytorum]
MHVVQQLGELVRGDRGALEQRDRGAAVTQPDDKDAHELSSAGGVISARFRSLRSLMPPPPRPETLSSLRGAVLSWLLTCSFGSWAFYRLEVLLLHAARATGLALLVEREDL